jgi:hypothetical protein
MASLSDPDSGYFLSYFDAVDYGDTLEWTGVPAGNYFLDTQGLQIPSGYGIWNILPVGNTVGGGSEHGWFASLSDDHPSAYLKVVYAPVGDSTDLDPASVDSDGDGAADDVEEAYGSDPNEPADHPKPFSSKTGGEVEFPGEAELVSVKTLPKTGAGTPANKSSESKIPLYAAIVCGGIAFAGSGLVKRRGN